jgi:predicted TIM-barrel fold metal-dependent hydrolase
MLGLGGVAAQEMRPPLADNHMHIQTPALSALLAARAKADPNMFAMVGADMLSPRTGADALKQLDDAGIREGSLLSEAYMWSSRRLKAPPELVYARTREEDAFNAAAAVQSGGRLHAFMGINPLWSGAEAEMRYWAGRPGVTGLKMHLANSGFDPKSPKDLARLAAVFDHAHALHLPVIIHVRNGKAYSKADAEAFITKVLPHIADTPIQIAHGGGWGGMDQETVDALSAYADAIARGAPGTSKLQIDLALVVIDDKTDPALAKRFAGLMRRIGLNRFLFASDWPGLYTPKRYEQLLLSQVPLTPAEWNEVFANTPAWAQP